MIWELSLASPCLQTSTCRNLHYRNEQSPGPTVREAGAGELVGADCRRSSSCPVPIRWCRASGTVLLGWEASAPSMKLMQLMLLILANIDKGAAHFLSTVAAKTQRPRLEESLEPDQLPLEYCVCYGDFPWADRGFLRGQERDGKGGRNDE